MLSTKVGALLSTKSYLAFPISISIEFFFFIFQVPDGSYKSIGAGLCRGPNWQSELFPKFEGLETIEGCAKECERAQGCTAFDISPQPDVKGRFRCVLHGHSNVVLADATSLKVSKCFVMKGDYLVFPKDFPKEHNIFACIKSPQFH